MERLSDRLLAWASLIDDKTVEQARTSARMPFIHPHLALMPDAHLGKGATVGSVVPTLGRPRRPQGSAAGIGRWACLRGTTQRSRWSSGCRRGARRGSTTPLAPMSRMTR